MNCHKQRPFPPSSHSPQHTHAVQNTATTGAPQACATYNDISVAATELVLPPREACEGHASRVASRSTVSIASSDWKPGPRGSPATKRSFMAVAPSGRSTRNQGWL